MVSRRWFDRSSAATLAVILAVLTVAMLSGRSGAVEDQPLKPRGAVDSPEELFLRDCAYCHGTRGEGTNRGPSLETSGTALVHFMLSTGRMPVADPSRQTLQRREPYYSEEEIAGLVEYIGQFTTGPEVPEVNAEPALQAEGGELYRLHCAQCHQFLGTGGVLYGSDFAPALHGSSAVEVVEAIRTGPGTMPEYSEEQISPEQADAIAAFVVHEIQQPEDQGGQALGHFGPFSEGAAASLAGLAVLLAVTLWIGRRT